MITVLAALDSVVTAPGVLDTAEAMASLTDGSVEAVHVHDGSTATIEMLARRRSIPLRVLDGPTEQTLLDAIAAPGVDVAVLGARDTPDGRRHIGQTAREVLQRAQKPIVVVPPETIVRPPRTLRRLLLPLEGTEESSQAITDALRPLVASEVDFIVLHVFTAATAPAMLDRPRRDLALLAQEFGARHCPVAERVELRTGQIGDRVVEVCREEAVDLVVLCWSRDMSPGHAEVVRDVLSRSAVPVLVLPAAEVRTPR